MSQYEFSVSAQVQFLPEESDPERRQYAFAYTLTIRNTGRVPAQLIARHWVITDSEKTVQEVKGLGRGGTPAAAQTRRAVRIYELGGYRRHRSARCGASTSAWPRTASVSTRPCRSSFCACRVRCIEPWASGAVFNGSI